MGSSWKSSSCPRLMKTVITVNPSPLRNQSSSIQHKVSAATTKSTPTWTTPTIQPDTPTCNNESPAKMDVSPVFDKSGNRIGIVVIPVVYLDFSDHWEISIMSLNWLRLLSWFPSAFLTVTVMESIKQLCPSKAGSIHPDNNHLKQVLATAQSQAKRPKMDGTCLNTHNCGRGLICWHPKPLSIVKASSSKDNDPKPSRSSPPDGIRMETRSLKSSQNRRKVITINIRTLNNGVVTPSDDAVDFYAK